MPSCLLRGVYERGDFVVLPGGAANDCVTGGRAGPGGNECFWSASRRPVMSSPLVSRWSCGAVWLTTDMHHRVFCWGVGRGAAAGEWGAGHHAAPPLTPCCLPVDGRRLRAPVSLPGVATAHVWWCRLLMSPPKLRIPDIVCSIPAEIIRTDFFANIYIFIHHQMVATHTHNRKKTWNN